MSTRHIFLGMPSYGSVTVLSARSFHRACADDTDRRRDSREAERDKITKEVSVGSLLAANMNNLWASALTLQRRGQRVDYFAMQHDDIAAEDFWVDKAIDEMESQGLDMLGVVAPIKDARGRTSIALASPDGDPFKVLCTLTMDEIYRLPATFTSNDTGYPILLNTGCWVCNFNALAQHKLHFTINDEITWEARANRYMAQVESEDWFFSRRCHEAGLKIGCTRKIFLVHEGPTKYLNTHPWGIEKFDTKLAESVIPQRADGFVFPHDVDGWLFQHEGEALFNLAKGKRVLEIGSYCGKSTICLAQSADYVLSVDPHDGRGTPVKRNTYKECTDNVNRYCPEAKVDLFRGLSEDLGYIPDRFDIAFIDGDHKEDSVHKDIDNALRLLKPDGLLAFHDYRTNGGDPGVKSAVDELVADGAEILSVHGSLAVVKPPAAIPLEV